jgi:hypothetical protein
MSEDLFGMVAEFQEKFGLEYDGPPRYLVLEEWDLKRMHIREEYHELCDATTLEEEFDALIDLVYVALGMAYRMGLPFNEGFRRVHAANMAKVRASSSGESKRNSTLDIIKPAGWVPANLEDLVK